MMRLWYYLQNEFSNYYVDCEFNKMWHNSNQSDGTSQTVEKIGVNINGIKKKIYVDIIIHKRDSNIDNQLICIEMKRNSNSDEDINRLKNMTNQQGFITEWKEYIFAYKYGFFISFWDKLKKPKVKIITIVDGHEFDTIEIYFNSDSLEEKAEEMK
jgi:hypothetical protein